MKKKLLSLLLALAMVFTLAACGEKKPDPGKDATATEPVVILHTNDVHGAIDKYAKVAALRDECYDKGAHQVILLDAGDYSQGSPYVSLSKGATALDMMALVGYDVITLGNHTWGKMQITDYLEDNRYILRPANFSPRTPGRGYGVYDLGRVQVAVLCLITGGMGELVPAQLVATALVCVGVVGLGIVEAHEDEDLRRKRQKAAMRRYAKSALALLLPIIYCILDAAGTFADSRVLDKLSAIAVDKGVQPVIVCTKGDLAEAEFLRKAYEKSTLPFIRIDYETGGGLDEVKQWISGRLCAFCGNSGVGKSTLLNHLLPEAERETSAISQKLGRGRHTTREVTIFEAFGGRIADTPGFASLEANRAGFIPKENLEHAFPEFGPYLGQCQFTGCSHRSEKGCAVRAALAEGRLSQTRYDSYCAMYEEVKDVKDWQRPKV